MKLAGCALLFLLGVFTTESQIAPPYGIFPHHPPHRLPYRHHQGHQIATCHGASRECPEGYTFRLELCGCFKDGDTLPVTKVPPLPKTPVVVTVPVPQPRPPLPRPRPPIPPPRCPRIFRCTALQVFDESSCQCVCITRIDQCPGATEYNKDKCKCECSNRPVCNIFQIFNELLCRCEFRFFPFSSLPQNQVPLPLPPVPLPLPPAPVPLPPLPFPLPPAPLPLPPAPLPVPATICPPSANLRCNVLQRLNPQTCQCECRQPFRCSFPKVLDPITCECTCGRRAARRCSSLQIFNDDTCECECTQVFVTVEIDVPGPLVPGPSIPGPLVPGPPVPGPLIPGQFPPPFLFPRISRTPGGRIRTFRFKRHARKVKEAEVYNQNVQGPQPNNAKHRKKRRTHTGPGPGPGGFFIPPILPPVPGPLVPGPPVRGPSIPGPLVPGPSRVVTERRRVPAPCPAGTFESRNCECF